MKRPTAEDQREGRLRGIQHPGHLSFFVAGAYADAVHLGKSTRKMVRTAGFSRMRRGYLRGAASGLVPRPLSVRCAGEAEAAAHRRYCRNGAARRLRTKTIAPDEQQGDEGNAGEDRLKAAATMPSRTAVGIYAGRNSGTMATVDLTTPGVPAERLAANGRLSYCLAITGRTERFVVASLREPCELHSRLQTHGIWRLRRR